MAQGDVHAVGEEGYEDVRLDALRVLVVDGADRQVALQIFEGLLNLHKLDVVAPQLGRIRRREALRLHWHPFAARLGSTLSIE